MSFQLFRRENKPEKLSNLIEFWQMVEVGFKISFCLTLKPTFLTNKNFSLCHFQM